jgi:hypothetical protein
MQKMLVIDATKMFANMPLKSETRGVSAKQNVYYTSISQGTNHDYVRREET